MIDNCAMRLDMDSLPNAVARAAVNSLMSDAFVMRDDALCVIQIVTAPLSCAASIASQISRLVPVWLMPSATPLGPSSDDDIAMRSPSLSHTHGMPCFINLWYASI